MQSLPLAAVSLVIFGFVSVSPFLPFLQAKETIGAYVRNGATYKILSASNHKVLDVENGVPSNGNPVIAFEWKQSKIENQAWVAEKLETPGVFLFSSVTHRSYVMDSSLNGTERGLLIVNLKHKEDNQQWVLEPTTVGSFDFVIRSLHDQKVLQLDSDDRTVFANTEEEANVKQLWLFAEVPELSK